MSRQLTAAVLVRNPETNKAEVLAEGSELPDWADGLVGDHALSGDGESVVAPDTSLVPSGSDKAEGQDAGSGSEGASEPPRAGRGSALEVWQAYAESQGIAVPEDASRDDIVALVDEAKQS